MTHDSVECQVHYLGQVDYLAAWELQAQLAAEIASGDRPPTLLLLEHPHTYTLGRSGDRQNLLWDAEQRAARGIQLFDVDRGGDVTYHGPGQLVGYPLLPLGTVDASGHLPQVDYLGYLRNLEQVLIDTLAQFAIPAHRENGLTGVWVQPAGGVAAKIASIGVKVDVHGISRHGFALNIDPEMLLWQGIVPCGIDDRPVTSIAELLPEPPLANDVIRVLVKCFGRVFSLRPAWSPLSRPSLQA
jgi:lipoyl(octanoyl) transferase